MNTEVTPQICNLTLGSDVQIISNDSLFYSYYRATGGIYLHLFVA